MKPITHSSVAAQHDHSAQSMLRRHEELSTRRLFEYALAQGADPGGPLGGSVPLTAADHLEAIALGEALARYFRHPADVDRAVKAGATWDQVAAARGVTGGQARQDYREWAEGQHALYTGALGGEAARFGLDDASYAAALARTEEPKVADRGAG